MRKNVDVRHLPDADKEVFFGKGIASFLFLKIFVQKLTIRARNDWMKSAMSVASLLAAFGD